MEEKYKDFNNKRMIIFSELLKRYWNDEIKNNQELNNLAEEIKDKLGFDDNDKQFIMDHIRIAMGLNPNNKNTFENELELVSNCDGVKKPVVSRVNGPCKYCESIDCRCFIEKKYEVPRYLRIDNNIIQDESCIDCGACVEKCDFGAIADKLEFLPVIKLLKDSAVPVFAVVAPAIIGQFGDSVNLGKLRKALLRLGFEDLIEVAMFADILTIKEAFEFCDTVREEKDFFLTSCCCPIWYNTIKKGFPNIFGRLSPSVSPMIASGRILKALYKNAKVVFIAPCIAKKSEAKEKELIGAIDFVLDFRELKEIFTTLDICLDDLPEYEKDQASYAGRIYARTGGVSLSVKSVVNRIDPGRVIRLKAQRANGIKECKGILEKIDKGIRNNANFIEGMGCVGGCVGGPKTIVDVQQAEHRVNQFGEDSFILTPYDNLNVIKMLKQLGVETIQGIKDNTELRKLLSRD